MIKSLYIQFGDKQTKQKITMNENCGIKLNIKEQQNKNKKICNQLKSVNIIEYDYIIS